MQFIFDLLSLNFFFYMLCKDVSVYIRTIIHNISLSFTFFFIISINNNCFSENDTAFVIDILRINDLSKKLGVYLVLMGFCKRIHVL